MSKLLRLWREEAGNASLEWALVVSVLVLAGLLGVAAALAGLPPSR